MSLLKQALELLGSKADDKADDWFDKLTNQLGELIEDISNDDLKNGGKEALKVLKDNEDKFKALGKKSLILFVANVAADNTDEATKEYYRSKASVKEIIDSILDDAIDIEKIRKQREELKKEALELCKLLLTGAKFLLPLLLTFI